MSDSDDDARIYKPGPNIKNKLKSLKAAIVNRPPFCSGTVPLAASDLLLYYGKPSEEDVSGGTVSRRLDLTKATEDELLRLVDVCDAATFGMNREDVLDVSYRSAWKLDPAYFATKLNIVHAGLMDSIRYNLLTGDQGKATFFAELYKLNVYGKGSFFKPHKDTPRGDKMFGSLVVVLPTAHEGGTLIIRHGGKEWKIESDTVTPSSITYAAFFGDVEHEVTEVTSGFRLTLTYNLYFGTTRDSQAIVSTPSGAGASALFTSLPPNANAFQSKLAELLADDAFLPMGGRLGFGLFHEYPFAGEPNLEDLTEVLKGNDAALMQACRALGLACVLHVCYEGDDTDYRTVALCSFVPNIEGEYLEEQIWEFLKDLRGVFLANSDEDNSFADEKEGDSEGHWIDLDSRGEDLPSIDAYVHWVTRQTSYNAFRSTSVAYGNEPSLSYDYGKVCLIVSVGPPGHRSDKPQQV